MSDELKTIRQDIETAEQKPDNLSARQAVVTAIMANPGIRQKDIMDATGLNAGYVSNLVRSLVIQGLVNSHHPHGYEQLYFFSAPAPVFTETTETIVQEAKPTENLILVKDFCKQTGERYGNILRWLVEGKIKGVKQVDGGREKWMVDMAAYTGKPVGYKKRKKRELTKAGRQKIPAARRREIASKAGLQASINRQKKKKSFLQRMFGG